MRSKLTLKAITLIFFFAPFLVMAGGDAPKTDKKAEIKAYIQVKDLTKENKNNVFVFNGWMFSSSPSIAPFDHPVYDIWLVSCY